MKVQVYRSSKKECYKQTIVMIIEDKIYLAVTCDGNKQKTVIDSIACEHELADTKQALKDQGFKVAKRFDSDINDLIKFGASKAEAKEMLAFLEEQAEEFVQSEIARLKSESAFVPPTEIDPDEFG